MYAISKVDLVKYILSRPILHGRLAKWTVNLEPHDLVHVLQKAVKGQALTNFLIEHLVPDDWELNDDLPGEEVFFVDVALENVLG